MENKQLSKIEIIDETIEWYKTHPLSLSEVAGEGCYYFHPKIDTMCAVGRCMNQLHPVVTSLMNNKDGEDSENGDSINYLLEKHKAKLDDILKEEYRGHPDEFWYTLQSFHDHPTYWLERGLSSQGKARAQGLRQQYAES